MSESNQKEGELKVKKRKMLIQINDNAQALNNFASKSLSQFSQNLKEMSNTINNIAKLNDRKKIKQTISQAISSLDNIKKPVRIIFQEIEKLEESIKELEDVSTMCGDIEESKARFNCWVSIPNHGTVNLPFENRQAIIGRETIPVLSSVFSRKHLQIDFIGNNTFECNMIGITKTVISDKKYLNINPEFYNNFGLNKNQKTVCNLNQQMFVYILSSGQVYTFSFKISA